MRTQAVQIEGDKATGITVDQLAAFVVDCRGLEERGLHFVRLEGRTTMGAGKLYRLAAHFDEAAPA